MNIDTLILEIMKFCESVRKIKADDRREYDNKVFSYYFHNILRKPETIVRSEEYYRLMASLFIMHLTWGRLSQDDKNDEMILKLFLCVFGTSGLSQLKHDNDEQLLNKAIDFVKQYPNLVNCPSHISQFKLIPDEQKSNFNKLCKMYSNDKLKVFHKMFDKEI